MLVRCCWRPAPYVAMAEPARGKRQRRRPGAVSRRPSASGAPDDVSPRRKWPNPMRLLLGLGSAAGAILSIAGVVGLLSPKEPPSPRGPFESVTADPGQGITEFSARLKTASMDTGRVDAVPAVYAATARVVRAAFASDPAEPGSTAPSGPDSTGSGTTPEATPESTRPQTTPSEPPPPTATENEQQQQPDGLEFKPCQVLQASRAAPTGRSSACARVRDSQGRLRAGDELGRELSKR
jgi:hypothetical protein